MSTLKEGSPHPTQTMDAEGSLKDLAGASGSVVADMSAADIAEAVADIKAEAKARGLGVCYVSISVATLYDANVDGTISLYDAGKNNITAVGDDFRSCVANLRQALDAHIPTEERLAAILGYSEQVAQAAE